ncbi:MAG: hypothetical protein ACC645_06710 [Pirellulales bacterium]
MQWFQIVGVATCCLAVMAGPSTPGMRAAAQGAAEVPPDPRSADARFMEGLRRRRLFSLAETHCRRRLADPGLGAREQADWTIELVRTLVGQAVAGRTPPQSPQWKQAHQTCAQFAKEFPNHPFAPLIALQESLTWIEQGKVARAMAVPHQASASVARSHFRHALRRLESLNAELKIAVRNQFQGHTDEYGGLTTKELQSLRNQTSFHWARALRLQGETYRLGEVDRNDALAQAVEKLTPLAELPFADQLVWQCRLERIACLRLLGTYPKTTPAVPHGRKAMSYDGVLGPALEQVSNAQQELARLDEARLPVDLRPLFEAERLRLLLASGDVEAARAVANEKGARGDAGSEELELARFETAFAAWRQAIRQGSSETASRTDATSSQDVTQPQQDSAAKNLAQNPPVGRRFSENLRAEPGLVAVTKESDEQPAALGKEVAQRIDRIRSRFGPIAFRRAESLLIEAASQLEVVNDPVILELLAASFYHGGRLPEAVATYDRLAEEAARRQATDQSFRAAFTAATITRQQQLDQQAFERYHDLAQRMPDHPRAAESHLLAAFHAAELVRAASPATRPAATQRYAHLLEEELAKWPDAPTCNRARLWLGRLRESERRWHDAGEAYRQVRPEDPHYSLAICGVARCSAQLLANQAAQGNPTSRAARDAADFLEQCVTGPGGQWPASWSEFDRFCALTEAALLVHYDLDGSPRARQVLQRLLVGPPQPGPETTEFAHRLLVVAAAGEGDFQEAVDLLNRLDTTASGKAGPPSRSKSGEAAAGKKRQIPVMLVGWKVVFDDLMRMADAVTLPRRQRLAELALRVAEHVEDSANPLSAESARRFATRRAEALLAAGRSEAVIEVIRSLTSQHPKDGSLHEDLAGLLLSSDRPELLQAGVRLAREVERHSRPGGPRWFRARYLQATGHGRLRDRRAALRLIELTRALYPEMGGDPIREQFEQLRIECQAAQRER